MAERRGIQAQEANRIKGSCFVKPIIYGSSSKFFGKKREEDNHTHSWNLYVRPYYNEDMSLYVRKVVFKLHESYANHTRVVSEPPYEVRETGWGEFEAVIKIFFVDPAERHVNIYHVLKLFCSDPSVATGKKALVSEYYDEIVFQDPTSTMYNILNSMRYTMVGRHETDFENKRERTLKSTSEARDQVRTELSDLKDCVKEAKDLIQKFKSDLSKAEKEAINTPDKTGASLTPTGSVASSIGSIQESSNSATKKLF